MRPFGATLPFDDARRIVLDAAAGIARTEMVMLAESDGRVAATDALATTDVPPFDRAAMDGYAVRSADTAEATAEAPRSMRCVGRVFTGDADAPSMQPGECLEIATGAPLPADADAVVMVEATTRDDSARIFVQAGVRAGQNVGRRGQDMREGDQVVGAGQVINPSRVGALAATGRTSVLVYARPSVALLSTGDELSEPGRPLAPGKIYGINRFTLAAVVGRHGGLAAPRPLVGDTLDALQAALDAALAHDVVVFSGGSSVGDRDLVLDVLRARGRVHFHGIAVKPGKPTAFAHVDGVPVFALPGYPTSCLSNAYLLLVPFLRSMARLPPWDPHVVTLPLSRRLVSTADRHQFYTVRIVDGQVEPAFKASGDITSMANADGYMEIPVSIGTIEAGTPVRVTIFG